MPLDDITSTEFNPNWKLYHLRNKSSMSQLETVVRLQFELVCFESRSVNFAARSLDAASNKKKLREPARMQEYRDKTSNFW